MTRAPATPEQMRQLATLLRRIGPCKCSGRSDEEMGRCSAIPPCCRRWFADTWMALTTIVKVESNIRWLRWDYVPCPGCRQCGARIHVRRCVVQS